MKILITVLACVVSVLSFQPPVFAQETGQLRGRITDSSEGVVIGATVEAVNVATQVSRTTVSNELGYYSIPLLPAGGYTLKVSAAGFRSMTRSGITLQIDQVAEFNFTMQVGSVTQTVDVKTNASPVDTETSTLKGVIDERRIVDLPLNGRDATQLILLMPGVVGTTSDSGGLQQGGSATGIIQPGISANGARGNMVNYQLDGAPHNDTYTNVSLAMPDPDALQEFSVQTSNFSAEYGRSAGAIVNAISRSGANSLHGDLFEFNRNAAVSALNFFDTQSDGLKRNQFGGTLGGPVFIPHLYHGRDRTFFFFSEQETRQVQTPSDQSTTVLTAAQRAGDFSAYPQPIIDPQTGLLFPNNQIPLSREDAVTRNVLNKLIPLPSDPATGLLLYSAPNTNQGRQILAKIDHHFSNTDTLSISYLYNYYYSPAYNSPLVFATQPSNTIPNHNVAVNETHIFGPSTLNEFHFAVNRRTAIAQPVWTTGFNDLGMQDISINSPTHDFNLYVNGAFNASVQEKDTTSPSDYAVSDVFRRTAGRHDISIGFSYQYQNLYKDYRWLLDPAMSFSGIYTGYGVADFFLGLPSAVEQNAYGQQGNQHMPVYGAFVQDNVRLTPRLTVNIGLRYDPFVPYVDKGNRMSLFHPGQQSTVYPNAPIGLVFPGDSGVPGGGSEPNLKNLAPRVGFAWAPFGDTKTSIRSGYGIFYDSAPMSALTNVFQNVAPYGTQLILTPPPGNFDNPYAGKNPFPLPFPPPRNIKFPPGLSAATFAPNFRTPYIQAWNFIVERQIHGSWVLRAAYAGSKGTALLEGWNENSAVYIPGKSTLLNDVSREPYAPAFQGIEAVGSNGNSSYNSLQVTLEKRFSQGFTILANYTWAKSIDYGSGAGTDWPQFSDSNNFAHDRGLSDFNVAHRFVTSAVWDLPYLNHQSGIVRAILGSWNVSGILTAQSGQPFSIYSGVDNSLSGNGLDRADQVGNPARPAGVNPINEWFNTQAFVPNAIGTYGNTGRNILIGPGLVDIDVSLAKSIPLTETIKVQFRAEAFNALNHPNFGLPSGTLTSGTYGRITSALDPRILQFSLKLIF
ncbi:MAG: carboxypeptidase regulatory-like domain-containing protein [Bryobacteraceae bacterium]